MNICKIITEDYLYDIFYIGAYSQILKYREHFLKCPKCFNKLLRMYFHYFSRQPLLLDKTYKDVVVGSKDPEVGKLIQNNFETGGKMFINEDSFYNEKYIESKETTPVNVASGALFVSFFEAANNVGGMNSIIISGEIVFPEPGPFRELVMILLSGFSNIKHIDMYNEHKLFDIEGKTYFYQQNYFKNLCCAFALEKTKDYGFLIYLQGQQNTERVILCSPKKLTGEIKWK